MKILIFLSLCGLSLAHLRYEDEPKMEQTCNCGWTNENEGENKYPWIAGIMRKQGMKHIGGGAIISLWHVLSTAGLTGTLDPKDTVVCLGAFDESFCDVATKPNVYGVREIKGYWIFDTNKKLKDLSLIVLDKKIVESKTIGPICFPHEKFTDSFINKDLKMTGYGTEPKNQLKELDLKAVTVQECKKKNEHLDTTLSSQMCTYSTNGDKTDTDIGNPVVWLDPDMERYTIVGVLSYGPEKQSAENPAVNTNVSNYNSWVANTVLATDDATICEKYQSEDN